MELICTKIVHLGLSKVAFVEVCRVTHVRGVRGLYEGFHCTSNSLALLASFSWPSSSYIAGYIRAVSRGGGFRGFS